MKRSYFAALALPGLAGGFVSPVSAQTTGSESYQAGANDIVVTAQKREQRLNDVGITVTAATGEQLLQRGITSVADLPRRGERIQFVAFMQLATQPHRCSELIIRAPA